MPHPATAPAERTTHTSLPTVGEMIIHFLKLEGVTHVFGVPGGGLAHFLVNLKDNHDAITYVVARQETGAAYMADGYYRATGKMGVVVVTSGPGATNALTGVMNAQADGSAVLLITGEVDQRYDGMGYLQEGTDAKLDIKAIFQAAVGYSTVLEAGSSAQTLVKQVFRNVLSNPRQTAHISVPDNVTAQTLSDARLPNQWSSYRAEYRGNLTDEARKALKYFLPCKRPLIFLGNGCREALKDPETYDRFVHFIETYAIPVITTADAKGILSEDHQLSLRVYGIADCMWPYAYMTAATPAYDGLLVIGSQLGELSTNKWLPLLIPEGKDAPFIQLDLRQSVIGRSFEVSHGIVGEAGAFINDLSGLMNEFPADKKAVADRQQFVKELKKKSPFVNTDDYDTDTSPIHPAALMRGLQDTLPENSKLFIDAGNCVGWSVHYLEIYRPAEIFTSLSMGPMGFAVGAVVGGKIGAPEATCIALVGDGAFMMQGSEISTAKQYGVGAIWIVLNDNNLAMVSQGMDHFFPDSSQPRLWHELYELGAPDLVKYAEGLGAEAYRIGSLSEFTSIMTKVLEGANKRGVPQVIVVDIDRKAEPPYYNPVYGPRKTANPPN